MAAHRAAAAADQRSLSALMDEAAQCPPTRPFEAALRPSDGVADGVAVISEVKRRSPSKGDLNVGLDPAALASAYAAGGASALSVLTDVDHFGGSAADLCAARSAVTIPVLRKDFTIDARDVADARIMGADAVLLIVAALDDTELADFFALATELELGVLVETHDEAEVDRALAVGATVIGVNQRDLVTFQVDTDRAVRVAAALPDGVTRVAESGIGGPADVGPLVDAGFHAVLVGESLVRSGDPEAAVRALRSVS